MTDERLSDPTTEEELETLERFLREGATTIVKVVEEYTTDGDTVAAGTPAILTFGVEGRRLADALAGDPSLRVRLILEATRPTADDFFLRVFINEPDANPDSSLDEGGYIGSIAFFGEAAHHEVLGPSRFELDATGAVVTTAEWQELVAATIVAVVGESELEDATTQVNGARLQLISSLIVPA